MEEELRQRAISRHIQGGESPKDIGHVQACPVGLVCGQGVPQFYG